MNSNIINALGNSITINNVAKYILGNMTICKFIAVFMFALSCYSCIFNFLQISICELTARFSQSASSEVAVADSVFFWIGAFDVFVILYSKHFGKKSQIVFTVLLLIVIFIAKVLSDSSAITRIDASVIPVIIVFIPVLLLDLISKTAPKKE